MNSLLQKNISPRTTGVVVALALLAGAVVGGERGERAAEREAVPSSEAKRSSRPVADRPAEASIDLDLELLHRSARQGTAGDLFLAAIAAPPPSPRLAPPPPPAPARSDPIPPAKPSPPALPFTYLGRLTDRGQTKVFLSRNNEALSLAAGDSIDGLYRVESIREGAIEFIYLPLGERQTLAVAAPK